MKKLFIITLGGKAKNSNIEVHDVQFIIAENLEETYAILKENWYGIVQNLHIDAYKQLDGVEGYNITIKESPVDDGKDNKSLYFVNIGGYDESLMHELHKFGLLVCSSKEEAKGMAKKLYPSNFKQPHVDNVLRVDNCKMLNKLYKGYIHLSASDKEYTLEPDWYGYRRLDK